MSMNKELEELRRIRAAEREAAEEAKRIEAEKQKERDRKSAFLMKASSFEQRKGPTDEEVKASIQKASAARKFNRMLSKQLSTGDGKNAISTELGLRNKLGNQSASTRAAHTSDWQLVEQEGGYPYYWNRVTNEVTYDVPEDLQEYRPPTPPRRQLPGMGTSGSVATGSTDWVLVQQEDGSAPYYWNSVTNEVTYTEPEEGFVTSYASQDTAASTTDEASQWISGVDPTSGYTYYYNTVTQQTQWEVPECLAGQVSSPDPPAMVSDSASASDVFAPQPAETTPQDIASPSQNSNDPLGSPKPQASDPAVSIDIPAPRAVSMPRGMTKDPAFLSQLNNRISMRTTPVSTDKPVQEAVFVPNRNSTSVNAANALALARMSFSSDDATEKSFSACATAAAPPVAPASVSPPPSASEITSPPSDKIVAPPTPPVAVPPPPRPSESTSTASDDTAAPPSAPPATVPPPPRSSETSSTTEDASMPPAQSTLVPPPIPSSSAPNPPPPPPRPSSTSATTLSDAQVVTGSLICDEAESSTGSVSDQPVPTPSNVPPPPRPPPRPSDLSERPSNISSERPSSLKSVATTEQTLDDNNPFRDGITTQELLNQLNAMKVSFDDYVDNYCNFERKGILKRRTTAEKLTHWKSDLIRTSLRADVTNEKDSVQLFRNVTGYMGDRSSSKPPDDHAVKILNIVLRAPEEVRDELYTQICKQTNHNPSIESTIKGWQLMTLCLSVVRPSNVLMLPLMSYCAETIKFAQNSEIAKYAEICLHNIPKICRSGSRKEIPTADQRASIVAGTLLCGDF